MGLARLLGGKHNGIVVGHNGMLSHCDSNGKSCDRIVGLAIAHQSSISQRDRSQGRYSRLDLRSALSLDPGLSPNAEREQLIHLLASVF